MVRDYGSPDAARTTGTAPGEVSVAPILGAPSPRGWPTHPEGVSQGHSTSAFYWTTGRIRPVSARLPPARLTHHPSSRAARAVAARHRADYDRRDLGVQGHCRRSRLTRSPCGASARARRNGQTSGESGLA